MFKKISLAVKIGGGFGTVILLLAVVSSVSWFGTKGVADGFTTCRSLARNSNLVGNLQSYMLALRLSVEVYIRSTLFESEAKENENNGKVVLKRWLSSNG